MRYTRDITRAANNALYPNIRELRLAMPSDNTVAQDDVAIDTKYRYPSR